MPYDPNRLFQRGQAPGEGGQWNMPATAKYYGGDPNINLLEQMGKGGGNWEDMLTEFLKGWSGRGKHIPEHLQRFAPFFLMNLLRTPQARDVMDFQRQTQLAFAPAAARVQSGVSDALRQARGSLALSGVSASGAYPMLEAQMRMAAAGQLGQMYQGLQTQNIENRWNIVRDIAGMGLGMPPQTQPRDYSWLGGLGAGLGALGGYLLTSPGGGQNWRQAGVLNPGYWGYGP